MADEKLEKIWNVVSKRKTDPAERPEVAAAGERVSKMLSAPCTYAEALGWKATGEGWNAGGRHSYTYTVVRHTEAVAAYAAWQDRVESARREMQIHAAQA